MATMVPNSSAVCTEPEEKKPGANTATS